MSPEQEQEIKKLVQAEVRNAFEKVRKEQENISKQASEEALDKMRTEVDALFGKISRGQAILEKSVETLRTASTMIKEDLEADRKTARALMEKITKIEYITPDAETMTKVKSFMKSPVKYLIKTIVGIE